jgi:ABC-type nitrate/sulfonate/bicarbonate transport system substrate-binding protein
MPKNRIWHSTRYFRFQMPHREYQKARPIRLGFVPLVDCAAIAVARETGIFERHGLDVDLSRELGWASVREKIFYESLEAAEAIAGIAFALGLGFNELRSEVMVPLVLNLHGNAITLSVTIPHAQVLDGSGLRRYIKNHWNKDRPFTLAATHRFSSHYILLYQWLRRHGVSCPEDVEIIFLPPQLMPRHLKAGHIDGFCVGEPWNSEAILAGTGWCPASSANISHGHPEKVLLLSGTFLRDRKDDALALVSALAESSKLCQDPIFRHELISILALKAYTGASEEVLRNSLGPTFETGIGTVDANSFHIFHGEMVNRPTIDKASWVLSGLREIGTLPEVTAGPLSKIYREDLFDAAMSPPHDA